MLNTDPGSKAEGKLEPRPRSLDAQAGICVYEECKTQGSAGHLNRISSGPVLVVVSSVYDHRWVPALFWAVCPFVPALRTPVLGPGEKGVRGQ